MKETTKWLTIAAGISLAGILSIQAASADDAPATQRARGLFRWRQREEQPQTAQQEEKQPSIRERMMQRKPDVEGHEMRREPLSEEEQHEVREAAREARMQARLDDFFERFDKNRDGCISRDELRAYFESRKHEKR